MTLKSRLNRTTIVAGIAGTFFFNRSHKTVVILCQKSLIRIS